MGFTSKFGRTGSYAYFNAKKQVVRAATPAVPIAGLPLTLLTVIRDWMKELLGEAKPDKRYTGKLAVFFEHMVGFLTHLFFGPKGYLRVICPELIGPNIHFLTPEEVDHVFKKAFTQYYPHEHLDLPPYKQGSEQSKDPLYQPYQPYRGQPSLIRYLEEQIQYISEELSKIELDWVRSRTLPASHESRHDVLIRLGHVLHAVEDYFFHSNFIEIYQWGRLLRQNALRKADNPNDREWLLLHSLKKGRSSDPVFVLLRRKFARRLRYPLLRCEFHGAAAPGPPYCYPSRDDSKDATTLVYTGGFEANDMYHTIHGGLGHIEEFIEQIPVLGSRIINTKLTLFRVMFKEEERRRMADAKYKDKLLQEHRERLRAGDYHMEIDKWQNEHLITDRAAEELQSAFKVDQELDAKYKDKFPKGNFFGVGGFLISLLAQAQEQVESSKKQVERLSQKEKSILDKGTDNGASEEQIGTHSLLAKDSKETRDDEEKQLLRDEAVALAKHASAALAVLLAERVNREPNPAVGLDWDGIVRYYVRFPNLRLGQWEATILASVADGEAIPDVNAVKDRPNFRLLGPGFGAAKLQQRQNGDKTKVLEKRYQDLEAKADRLL